VRTNNSRRDLTRAACLAACALACAQAARARVADLPAARAPQPNVQVAAGAPFHGTPCPAQVRVSFPNFEIKPLVLGTDRIETPPGKLVEWTRRALAATGCKSAIALLRRPPNRQLAELDYGLLDILPGFSHADSLAKRLAFPMADGVPDPMLAVMRDTASLYVRAGDKRIAWNGNALTGGGALVVGTSTGGASGDATIIEHGWRTESAPTPFADMQKLIAGRIDVILEPDVIMARYLDGADGRLLRKLTPPVRVSLRYAPVRAAFQQQFPDFTRRFWHAICVQSRADDPALGACR
jgi:hypothetical protein